MELILSYIPVQLNIFLQCPVEAEAIYALVSRQFPARSSKGIHAKRTDLKMPRSVLKMLIKSAVSAFTYILCF